MAEKAWRRITGSGVAFDGPCLLTNVLFWPDSDADYVDVYDGRDATAGRKFLRVEVAVSTTLAYDLGGGVPFDVGIYVAGIDGAVETTVAYIPR